MELNEVKRVVERIRDDEYYTDEYYTSDEEKQALTYAINLIKRVDRKKIADTIQKSKLWFEYYVGVDRYPKKQIDVMNDLADSLIKYLEGKK